MNPRWKAWADAEGLTEQQATAEPWRFTQWVDRHLVEWAKSEGFVADPHFDPPGSGVVVRTQAEANQAALTQRGGQDRFTKYLQDAALEESTTVHLLTPDCRSAQCGRRSGRRDADINWVTCGDCLEQHARLTESDEGDSVPERHHYVFEREFVQDLQAWRRRNSKEKP